MSDDNPTLRYTDGPGDALTLELLREQEPAAPRRRRWPWVLLIVVVLLAVLVVAAELLVRSVLPGIVRGIVVEQLDLPADQQLDVQADGILLPQLIAGRLDELHLSTDDVTFAGISGAADVTAFGVALSGDDLASASGTVRIDQSQFQTLVTSAELPIDTITFAAPDVTAEGTLSVLGIDIPVALTATPGAADGDLTLTPVRLLVAGAELNAAQVADRFGEVGARLTETQRICIADQLPAGVVLTDLEIEGAEAVIDLSVDGGIVSDESLRQNGACD